MVKAKGKEMMLTKRRHVSDLEMRPGLALQAVAQRIRPAPWQTVALVSLAAGVGGGWRAVMQQADLSAPFMTAAAMMLVTFAGWYVWGAFTHFTDVLLFGHHSDYRGTLDAFARAYALQALFFFTFSSFLGLQWGWIAFYATIAVWGIVGPRRLGMHSWQAIVAATCGMLLWIGCLVTLTTTLVWNGAYVGIGVFAV